MSRVCFTDLVIYLNRYAVQLLTPSFLLAKINGMSYDYHVILTLYLHWKRCRVWSLTVFVYYPLGQEKVTNTEISEINELFMDAKTSAKLLMAQTDLFLK